MLEALSATGLRAVRYVKEIPSLQTLVANDIDETATTLMKKNFEFNQCPDSKVEGKSDLACISALRSAHERCN